MTCPLLSIFCYHKLANFIATYAFNYKEGSTVPPPKPKVVPFFKIDNPWAVCFVSFVFLASVMAIAVTYAHLSLQRKLRLEQLTENGIELAPLASIEDLTASELQSLESTAPSFNNLPATLLDNDVISAQTS